MMSIHIINKHYRVIHLPKYNNKIWKTVQHKIKTPKKYSKLNNSLKLILSYTIYNKILLTNIRRKTIVKCSKDFIENNYSIYIFKNFPYIQNY